MRPIILAGRFALLVLLVLLPACKKKEVPRETPFDSVTFGADASVAQPGSTGARKIDFSIQGIYKDQKPAAQPPFHEPGGAWTFFDAKTTDGTPFGFGFDELKKSSSPFAFGKVVLTAPDASAGKRLVALFARTFEGKVPPEKTMHPIEPKPISAAFLGVDTGRRAGGGFSGEGGGWYATKLFLQRTAIEAEVFFNFSLTTKAGEFSEKDPDYANDMVAFLAAELRDGPPPKRTPQTDPTLVEGGPKITWVRPLSGRSHGMSPLRDRYWVKEATDSGGERLVSLGFEKVDDRVEILTVAHRLGGVRCAGDLCLVADSRPKDPSSPNTWAFDDPTTVRLVDSKKKTSIALQGEGDHPSLPQEAAAPDGSLFVLEWHRKTGGNANQVVLYLYGPDGKGRGPIDLGKESANVISVTKTRILVEVGKKYGRDKKLSYVQIDPASLAVSPTVAPPDAIDASENAPVRSPDKKRTAQCRREGAEIVIRDGATGAERVFAVHEDDRAAIKEGCVRWASSRFLEYHASVIGWLDADTMKIALGLGEAGAGTIEYDKDFKWAVDSTDGKLRLGKIAQ